MSTDESRRIADIGELDEDAQRLRVQWRKTHNFAASFAKVLMEAKEKFEASDYGTDKYGFAWTFHAWLGFKAGLIESQVYRFLDAFEKTLNQNDREIIATEKQRIAEEKRAERERIAEEKRVNRAKRQQEREDDQEVVNARKQAAAISQQIEDEASQLKKKGRTGTNSRERIIEKHAIDAVKEAVKNNQLSVTRAAEIGRASKPPELQAELLAVELANPRRATLPKRVTLNSGKDLTKLTKECRKATLRVLVALELDNLEVRRERVRAYGVALLPIRDILTQTVAFNAHLKVNKLEVRDSQWRSDAMWLAANWDGIQHSLSECPHMNPSQIRKWIRQHDESFRHMPKADSEENISVH